MDDAEAAGLAEQLAWHNTVNFAPDITVADALWREMTTFEAFVQHHHVRYL